MYVSEFFGEINHANMPEKKKVIIAMSIISILELWYFHRKICPEQQSNIPMAICNTELEKKMPKKYAVNPNQMVML